MVNTMQTYYQIRHDLNLTGLQSMGIVIIEIDPASLDPLPRLQSMYAVDYAAQPCLAILATAVQAARRVFCFS